MTLDDRLARALKTPATVRELDLSGRRLGVVPDELAKLKNLEILRLDHNELVSLPPAIGKLKKLRELHAAHNRITSEKIDRSVWFIPALAVLDLHGNQLTWIDNLGNYQKTEMALHLGGNPLDTSAYKDWAGTGPMHPLWTHVLHMFPLIARGKFKLRTIALDLERISFPLPGPQLHYDPPFADVRLLQLYGRDPSDDERTQLEATFPGAAIEVYIDVATGPHASKPAPWP